MKKLLLLYSHLLIFSNSFLFCPNDTRPPQLTVVFVIDQLAYRELNTMQNFFSGGLKTLCDQGICYTRATIPHGTPRTSPGLATITTGALPRDHGIIDNNWPGPRQQWESADTDHTSTAAVFAREGVYPFGKSAKNLMVDNLSDQLVLNNITPHKVYSIAFKSTSAIFMAGHLGKAFWFDPQAHPKQFTTSKYYFNELPLWFTHWNKNSMLKEYQAQNQPSGLVSLPSTSTMDELVTDLAYTCLQNHLLTHKKEPVVLWLGYNALDHIGHTHGPDSLEVHEYILKLDKLLHKFIQALHKNYKPEDILLVLTADHGVAPVPEHLQSRGLNLARRINATQFIQTINTEIFERHGITGFVTSCSPNSLYLDRTKLSTMNASTKQTVLKNIKQILCAQPGIQNAWTFEELSTLACDPHDVRSFLKNQLYPQRSGQIIFLVQPYTLVTDTPTGTDHQTPYEYDTHVPLIIYKKGSLEKKTITQPVYIQQLAGTLAHILHINRPAAATFDILPGIL